MLIVLQLFRILKLIDFGLSKRYRKGQVLKEPVGTLYSMAPEVLSGSYTKACDMWSIGVIAYMMMSGKMPFDGISEQEVVSKIKLGSFSMEGGVWSTESTDFIRSLVRVEPHRRMTADDALGHEWLHREWATFQVLMCSVNSDW